MPQVFIPKPDFVGCSTSTVFHLASAASTNLTLVRAGFCLLLGWSITNTNAAARYIVFHDTSKIPIAGANVYLKYGIPASGAANMAWSWPIPFRNGMGISLVTGAADTDVAAVAANDLIVNLLIG